MAGKGFRFLQASNLELDTTLTGVTEVPEHLVDLFLNARIQAAERVVQTALEESVDFVLLAGRVVQVATADPRALEWLLNSFQRLQRAKIGVYWLNTPYDRTELWPATVHLPTNVECLPAATPTSVTVARDGEVLATLMAVPTDRTGRIRHLAPPTDSSRFTIAMAQGDPATVPDVATAVDFWAIGGAHQSYQSTRTTSLVLQSGSPQGGSPTETGPHGCHVVDVNPYGKIAIRFVPTDIVRWQRSSLLLSGYLDRDRLLLRLRDEARRISEQAAPQATLISWSVADADQEHDTPCDRFLAELRQGHFIDDLLTALREEFGQKDPPLWSVSLTVEPPSIIPVGWLEEDTVLGDLLRQVEALRRSDDLPIELCDALRTDDWPMEFPDGSSIPPGSQRDAYLQQVAALGVDLLRGNRVLIEEVAAAGEGTP